MTALSAAAIRLCVNHAVLRRQSGWPILSGSPSILPPLHYNVEFTIQHIVDSTVHYLVQCIVLCDLYQIIQKIGLAA